MNFQKKQLTPLPLYLITALQLSILLSFSLVSAVKAHAMVESKPKIYASFFPIYELVGAIAEDTIELHSFMPKDKEVHDWEPSARAIKNLGASDLLFINGAGLENWVPKIAENIPDLPIVKLANYTDLIQVSTNIPKGDYGYMSVLNLEKDKPYGINFGHTHETYLRLTIFPSQKLSEAYLIAKARENLTHATENTVKTEAHFKVNSNEVYRIELAHHDGKNTFEVPKSGEWVFVAEQTTSEALPYRLVASERDNKPLEERVLKGTQTLTIHNDHKHEHENGNGHKHGHNHEYEHDRKYNHDSHPKDKQVFYDPHAWLSAKNAQHYLEVIRDELIQLHPAEESRYQENFKKIVRELQDLDKIYTKKFATVTSRDFVVTHPAFGYIARDYNLKQYSLGSLVSSVQPSLKEIRTAIEFAQQHNIKTIFYEYGSSSREAEVLAEEIGGHIAELVTMEYSSHLDDIENNSFLDLLKRNLEMLYQALAEEE